MKQSEINSVFQLLNRIKLNKVADKPTRNAIMTNHLRLYKKVEAAEKDIQELQKRLFEGKEKEMEEYNKLVSEGKPVSEEMKALVKEFNEAAQAILDNEVDVKIEQMEVEKFLDIFTEQDMDISMGDVIYFQNIGLLKE